MTSSMSTQMRRTRGLLKPGDDLSQVSKKRLAGGRGLDLIWVGFAQPVTRRGLGIAGGAALRADLASGSLAGTMVGSQYRRRPQLSQVSSSPSRTWFQVWGRMPMLQTVHC